MGRGPDPLLWFALSVLFACVSAAAAVVAVIASI